MTATARRLATFAGRRPWLVTAALCVVVAAVGVQGPDFPAQQFRIWLFRVHGAMLFDSQWFAGHPLPGYSLLFPPLAALVGSVTLGALSCVGSTWIASRILRESMGEDAPGRAVGLVWFAVVTVADLIIGRLPFALGLTLGLAAVYAAQRRRPVLGALAAAGCSLASPLAAGFLLLAGLAWLPSVGWRRVLPFAASLLGLAFAFAFGGGGDFPFVWSSLVSILVFVALGLWLCPDHYPTLRRGLWLYGISAVVLFLVPNPVGGNLTRLGTLLAGPVAAAVLLHAGRRLALALLVVPLLVWQLQPVYGAVADSVHDPSASPSYYTGLLSYLGWHGAALHRVEIPLTRDHWETSYVAAEFPLARGWERQLDTRYDALLYQPGLTAAAYHQWLVDNGVRYVALPDVPLDPSSRAEVKLLQTPYPWLVPVWHDAHWKVWLVRDAGPLAIGDATITALGVSSFTLDFTRPGAAVVLVHYTRLWRVAGASGCVTSTPDGWTEVDSPVAGPLTVKAGLNLPALDSLSIPACLPPPG